MTFVEKYASIYHTHFGFNVLPVRGKRPTIKWDKWQSEKQTIEDIEKMDWNKSTEVGICIGLDDLRLLDFDAIKNAEILENFITDLELPANYPWVVESGSGQGFHISFRTKESDSLKRTIGDKAVYKLEMKKEGYCKHIELRWKNCQTVFPPSKHKSGGAYKFFYNEPKEAPVYIDNEILLKVLEKYCVITSPTLDSKVERENDEKFFYDTERLESALDHLGQNLPANCYEDWYRIGFGLVPLGAIGEEYFIEMSLASLYYQNTEIVVRKKFADLKEQYDGRLSLGTIYHIAEKYGWKKPVTVFWSVDEKAGVKINRTRFKRLLESEGFCKYKMDNNYLFINVENNIVREIDPIEVKEFVMRYLDQLPVSVFEGTSKAGVLNVLIKSSAQLFTLPFLEFLKTKNIEFNRDTEDSSFLYFKNGFVIVTKNGETFHNYNALDKCIWKRQIIDRDYFEDERGSIFEEFLFNICRSAPDRFNALQSSLGYLMHTYKNPSETKAIIFIDEKMSEGSFGRSGKGLVIKSVAQVRNVIVQDGRNFNPSKNFAFQRVRADTNIIALEDIRSKFPFENLFSILTEGITIERKNRDEIFMAFSESPKLVISTNFSIGGVDDSTLDRQFVVEFSDYYNKNHKPLDDFGQLFFDGWDTEEWNKFDSFMINCLKTYLQNGLVAYEQVNINQKKLIDGTSPEFVEFSEGFEIGREYDKKQLYQDFKNDYSDLSQMSQGKFTRWLKVYGRIRCLEIAESKSGAKRSVVIVDPGKTNAA